MRRLPFVPARDPRHRAAALALYRALVRSARRVPLPEDLLLLHRPAGATPKQKHATAATAAATAVVPPRLGPIAETVRRRVAGNRAYTSLRLVYASMAAGYRFLEVLARARDVSSPENAQLVAHIRSAAQHRDSDSHPAKQQQSLETDAPSRSRPRRRAPFVPQPLPEPLIVNAAPPGHPPSYVSSSLPRPRASLDAGSALPRRVPSLCSTADGQPFLRMAKPQPRALSRMVGRKDRIFQRSIYKIVEIDDELVPAAVLEDEWDGLVAEQMRREGVTALDVDIEAPGGEKTWHGNGATARSRASSPSAATSSYSWSVQLARLWWEWRVEKTWQDWTARGIALSRIVEEERALAELERDNGDNHNDNRAVLPRRPKPDPPNTKTGRTTRDGGSGSSSSNTTRPNVAEHPAPPLPLLSAITSRLGHGSAAQLDGKDPFLSAAWTTLVEAERPRLMKWLARGAAGRTNNGDAPASR